MSLSIEQVLKLMGVEIAHEIPCCVPEDSPSLCVQIYDTSGGGSLGLRSIDIVTQLIISRETCYDLRLVLLHNPDLLLSLPPGGVKQLMIHGLQEVTDGHCNSVAVILMTIPSRLPRTQPDTDS